MLAIVLTAVCGGLVSFSSEAQESIRIGTYNIERFSENFTGRRATTQPGFKNTKDDEFMVGVLELVRRKNDEDNWEAARVIQGKNFDADILVVQEGCDQKDLDYFNHHWLADTYETAICFKTNTTRDQNLDLLIKPGFKLLERKDQYYLEPDTVANERGERLFARGPAFVLVQAPGGYKFWVGTNHQKSKSGNSVEVTQWRNREAKRTHQIIKEVEKMGPSDVIFLGDMNDELGYQPFEIEAGGDAISLLVGDTKDGLFLATKKLIDAGEISFGGYEQTNFRSFIDQIIVTPSVKDQILDIKVVQDGLTSVASDHYPVLLTIKPDPVPTTAPSASAAH